MVRKKFFKLSAFGLVAAAALSRPAFATWIIRVTGENDKGYKGTVTYVPDGRWLKIVLLVDGKVVIF